MMPGKDWDSLQENIQSLLSFEISPLKKSSKASSPITNPIKPIADSLKQGRFRTTFKGRVGGLEHTGMWGYYDYIDLGDYGLKDIVIHLYQPSSVESEQWPQNATIVLHSHARDEYCPYRHGCHTYLYGTGKAPQDVAMVMNKLPEWFKEMWKDVYNLSESNGHREGMEENNVRTSAHWSFSKVDKQP